MHVNMWEPIYTQLHRLVYISVYIFETKRSKLKRLELRSICHTVYYVARTGGTRECCIFSEGIFT